MDVSMRFVFDTNVLVSASLLPSSLPAQALYEAEAQGVVLYSEETLAELIQVLERPKLRHYANSDYITGLYHRIRINWLCVRIMQQVIVCRDEKDNKFLEVVLNGTASHLITGDKDLLVLSPFHNTQILPPADFLKIVQ
jgi:putative PIN family toxin of toxin-antitoxin system